MKTQEQDLTGAESIRIITEMISKTKANIRHGSFHLLFWGWLIVFCSLSSYALYRFTDYTHPYYVWFLTMPGVIVSLVYGFVKGRKSTASTYADRLYMWTWMAFIFAAIVLFILLNDNLANVTPFIMMLAGIPTFISGIIVKFRPLIIGAVMFWLLAIAARFAGNSYELLFMAAAVIGGYLVPGYLLKRRAEHETL